MLFGGFPCLLGQTPSTPNTARKVRRNSGKTPKRSQSVCWNREYGAPKPYNSRHLKAPEHFQKSLPPPSTASTAGDASFFRSGSGEGLSESVMEFPAVLGVFLIGGQSQAWYRQSLFNKHLGRTGMSHLCDSKVAGPAALRDNQCTGNHLAWPPLQGLAVKQYLLF